MPFDQVRIHARDVRDMTATYLREAIIKLLDISEEHRADILSESRNRPLGHWPVVKYVRGQLKGASDQLASEENEYPILSSISSIKSVEINQLGEYNLELAETFTPHLGEGISLQLTSHEVWAP